MKKQHDPPTLRLKTKLRMKDRPSARALAELFLLEFPEGTFRTTSGGGCYRLEIDIHAPVTPRQRTVLLDLLRTIDEELIETVYIQGELGDELLVGYLGPERAQKEKSRALLDDISEQLPLLLPEHRAALRTLLAHG